MNLSQEEILLILKILKDSEFDELDLKVGGLTMKARRKGAGVNPAPTAPVSEADPPQKATAREARIPAQVSPPQDFSPRASPPSEGLLPIKAPILGTFYRRPSPKEPPFVEVGTLVKEDDTVCLIEVMKVFSTIKAGVKGRIEEICVETGDLVEFGQPLFLVRPVAPGEKGA